MTHFLNSPNRRYLLPAAVIFGLLLTGCGCGINDLNFGREVVVTQRTLELSTMGVEKVAVTTTNGKVKFSSAAGENEAIEVRVSIQASGNDELSAQMTADAVEILTPMEGENGATQAIRWEWRGGQRPPGSATVSFEVTLPGHLAVAGKSTNGTLEVEGTHSGCELASTNGRITVSGAPGPCKIATTNGRVQVKGDMPSCDVSATNGSIDVHGGTERLSIKTTNGRIEAKTYAKELHLETKNSQIEAEIFRMTGVFGNVKSHNGSVRLRMADDANIQLVCNTHNGRIDYDDLDTDALITIDRKSGGKRTRKLTATLGQGGTPLTVSTHNGSIRLKQGLDEWELAPPVADEEKEVSQNTATAPQWVVIDGKRIEIDAQGVDLKNGASVKLGENGDVIISQPPPRTPTSPNVFQVQADLPIVVEAQPTEPSTAAEPAEPIAAAGPAEPSEAVEPTEPVRADEPSEPEEAQASDDAEAPAETETAEDAEPTDDEAPESNEPADATDD